MTGETNAKRKAIVPLQLRNVEGRSLTVQAVLDTGFTDSLILPLAAVSALQLPLVGVEIMVLANGSQVKDIFVHAAENVPLLGMAMLDGCDVRIQVRDGGAVSIEPETAG